MTQICCLPLSPLGCGSEVPWRCCQGLALPTHALRTCGSFSSPAMSVHIDLGAHGYICPTGYGLGVRFRLCRGFKLDVLGDLRPLALGTMHQHHRLTRPRGPRLEIQDSGPKITAMRIPEPLTRRSPQSLSCTRTSTCWACLHALAV
jgi:hypothetical protein